MPSYAGNSLANATYLSVDAGLKTFTDHIDTIQTDGYYRFNLSSSSSLNLVMNGLSANADVNLLDSSGTLIQASQNSGLLAESINTTLNTGSYYIKVSGVSGAKTDYNLSFQTSFSTDLLLHNSSNGLNYIWGLGGANRTAVISGGTITDTGGNPLALPSSFSIPAVRDFNHDGTPDLLLHDSSNGLSYVWGLGGANGTTVVSGGTITDTGGNPLALPSSFSIQSVTDFNRDGTPDLLLHDSSTGRYYIWGLGGANQTTVVSGGTLTDAGGNPLALPSSFSIQSVTDFNHDGTPDLLLHDSSTGRYYIWGLGGANGTAVVSGGQLTDAGGNPLALPSSFSIPAVADFNRDGTPDLLLHDSNTGSYYIWGLGGANGTAVVSGGQLTDAGGTPLALPGYFSIPAVRDFNQDGTPDLLLHDSNTGSYYIWGMGGASGTAVVSGGQLTDANGNPLALPSSFSIPDIVSRALPIDVAGNDTTTAFDVGTLNGTGTYTDTVDGTDTDDFYKFKLLSVSDVSLTLNGLSADANVEIQDSNGNVISSSTNSGTTAELINLTNQVAGTYYVRVYSTGDSTSYNLSLTGNSGTPDLVGTSLSLTDLSNNSLSSIIVGQKFKVNFSVQNTGSGSTSNISSPFNVSFYISKDATIDTSDYQLHLGSNSAVVGDYTIASLNAGASTGTLTQTLILPPANDPFWDNVAGTYYIGMIVDSGDAIAETSETNNSNLGLDVDFATTEVILQDIDLVGVTLGFNLKTLSNTEMTKGFAGQTFNTNFQIQNTGTTDTNAAFTVSFYISTDATIDSADKLLGTYDITDLSSLIAGGSTGTLTKNLTLPPIGDAFWNGVLVADYYIGMVIDSGNTVIETTETNNSSVSEKTDYVKATISQQAVDLRGVASGFTVTDVDVSAGAAFDFNFSLENIGNTDSNPFKVAFYISRDNLYNPGTDRLLSISSDPNTPYYYDVSSLGASTSSGPLNLQQLIGDQLILPGIADEFWSNGNGIYHIGMVIDADPNNPDTFNSGVIDEVDEENNYSKFNPITDLGANYAEVNLTGVNRIDLQGEGTLSTSTNSGSANSTVDVTFQVKNYGNIDATKFRVGFYLSEDTTINPVANGSQRADLFVGALNTAEAAKFRFDSGLAGGATSGLITVTLKLPSSFTSGVTYRYLGMYVDSLGLTSGSASGEVAEIDETNNGTMFVPFTIS